MYRLFNITEFSLGRRLIYFIACWIVCLLSGSSLAAELDGEKLNQIAQELVVTIEDSEGVSGGVVISSNGLSYVMTAR